MQLDGENALEYSEWVTYAVSNNLLFGPKDFAKLESDKKYHIVQIDYIKFLFIEYAERHNIKANKMYDPLIFFRKFQSEMTISGDNYRANLNTEHDKSFGGVSLNIEFDIIKGKWLSTGGGDGYSRWMLWNNLEKMPKFYFHK